MELAFYKNLTLQTFVQFSTLDLFVFIFVWQTLQLLDFQNHFGEQLNLVCFGLPVIYSFSFISPE